MAATALIVCAPLAGRIVALSDVPDLVFAQEMVGPGIAIDPAETNGPVEVRSPVTGTMGALHPHAFAVENPGGSVLVHLGLDTVTLHGEPFEVGVTQGEAVTQGEVIIRWEIADIGALNPLVPVVALAVKHVELLVRPGSEIEAGAPLFQIGTD